MPPATKPGAPAIRPMANAGARLPGLTPAAGRTILAALPRRTAMQVAVRRSGVASKLVWAAVAIIGATCLGVVALRRGEPVNAIWLVAAAIAVFSIGFRFYGKFVEHSVLRLDPTRAPPSVLRNDGLDYVPTDKWVVFGHHFAAIAGAGPLVGPVLAAQMGYLPGTMWIIIGVVLAGGVQDYLVLWMSTRRHGRSLGQMARDELGTFGGIAALVAVFVIMIILIAVLALVVVNALAESPWGVFSLAMTIPIALFMGFYLRYLRPGQVSEVTVIGVALLLLAIISGGWVAETEWGQSWFTLSKVTLAWAIIIYGFAASVLPVWMLL